MSDGHWQLEGVQQSFISAIWCPPHLPRGGWAEDLVDRTLVRSGELVLDVACRTGVDVGS